MDGLCWDCCRNNFCHTFSGFMCGILLSPTLRIWQTLSNEEKLTRDEYMDGGARKGFRGIFKLILNRKRQR
jgi:hypothetical protein